MFLAITISNNFPNKPILLKSYKLSPIYTYRIGLVSKIEKPKVNKNNFCTGKNPKQMHHGLVKKREPFWFRPPIDWINSIRILWISWKQNIMKWHIQIACTILQYHIFLIIIKYNTCDLCNIYSCIYFVHMFL